MVTPVHSYALGAPDPLFDPVSAQLVTVDLGRAVSEEQGIFNNGDLLKSVSAPEFNLIRSALLNYRPGTNPLPSPPAGVIDAAAGTIPLTANSTLSVSNVINTGSLLSTLLAADPFVMEYTGGLPMDQVAWGQLSQDEISRQTKVITLFFNIEITPPYLNQVQSSNAASHILRTMEQAVTGTTIPGAFGDNGTKLVVINSSDAYVAGVAGLLHAHWLLPGYQADYCAPGGNLVFELRQSTSGQNFVRVYYTAQTFDQLRNLTPLTPDQPPATMQLAIPGGTKPGTGLDVDFGTFEALLKAAIGTAYVQDPATEMPPGVLTGVPLQ